MKKIFSLAFLCMLTAFSFSQELTEEEQKIYLQKLDSVNNSFTYQYGKISLQNGLAEINIPDGYKFLDAKQSKFVLSELWGNPPSEVLGLLLPKDISPIDDNFTYAVEITYSDEGFIDDEDAKNLDYSDLLKEMQEDTNSINPERIKQGYPAIDLVGWASSPFYDEENKKLHWAKELNFEGEDINTLNYNIRVLGRKGYLNLNAIGTIDVLPLFKKDVDNILNSVSFSKGNTYHDFNPNVDKVAAYGIGGLIAGKVLAKAGFFALLLKFWKVIAIAIIGLFTAFKNKILGKPDSEDVS
ncbi:DUF2167 domain-containing protein [uncultured Tenacibaculum sp.]|uniref:DUF2167 domain-containing protein n=1 Tax=uncultured Tenacibaculum sp. TaxID=174713 RepID=UPI00261663A8|nr:DUF2167 domain-containing protein [uncultured Tenacibaculum sp.]